MLHSEKRIKRLCQDLLDVLSSFDRLVHVKRIVSVTGKIVSLTSCTGNVTRLMTRNLHAVISSSVSWNAYVSLTEEAIKQ